MSTEKKGIQLARHGIAIWRRRLGLRLEALFANLKPHLWLQANGKIPLKRAGAAMDDLQNMAKRTKLWVEPCFCFFLRDIC